MSTSMRVFTVATVALATVVTSTVTHAQDGESIGTIHQGIIGGDPITAEGSGMVLVRAGGLCSGTLLTNEWVITAVHCGLDTETPASVRVSMGNQRTVGAFAVNHPSLDFALIRLAAPMQMNGSATGYRVPLYMDSTDSLGGKTLTVRGYGCNKYTVPATDPKPFKCSGSDGTLREAKLVAAKGGYDDYNFDVSVNDRGQLTGPGDSGTGCFVMTQDGLALAGILKSGARADEGGATAHFGRPENWRDWALSYVNGTPIPLPAQWFVDGATPPSFLKSPLAADASGSHGWEPCPGSDWYEYAPRYDLEPGGDTVTLESGGASATFSGRGTQQCFGRGRITASILTNASTPSSGLLAMPIRCNSAPDGIGGPGCSYVFSTAGWSGAWGSDGPINVGDLNGDGKTDVFMWRDGDHSWTVNLSTGSGFQAQRWEGAWGSDGPIHVGDLNGDGKTDVFMWRDGDHSWMVNLSTGSGFQAQRWEGAWGSDGPINVGDLNGDRKTDVFMSRNSDHSWTVNLSTGNGFQAQRWEGAWGSDGPINVGDLNGDGKTDVFMSRDTDHSWTVNLSTGSGFHAERWEGAWGSDGPIRVADLNGDGRSDVFMWRNSDKRWTVNFSTGNGFVAQRWAGAWGSDGSIQVGDLNGDRKADIFMSRDSDHVWTINLSL